MKRFALLMLMLALPAAAMASAFTVSSASTARLGSKVISAGDSMKRVLEAGGEPIRRVDLTNDYGVKRGERWIYKPGNSRHIIIEFQNDGTVYGVRDVIGQ